MEDGYRLWLRYDLVQDPRLLAEYRGTLTALVMPEGSLTLDAVRAELERGLQGLLGRQLPSHDTLRCDGTLVLRTRPAPSDLGEEGYTLFRSVVDGHECMVIEADRDRGLLYGAFHLLRLIQTEQSLPDLPVTSVPRTVRRMLDHWDNLDRTVERGYAGFSIWEWHLLPDYVSPRYTDYARANASLGINSVVINNVNASALILTRPYLLKVAALASALRPYGIQVLLSARFSAPVEIGGIDTADPLDDRVAIWWQEKAREIYDLVPDFGGFLVKANSEGQPGPGDYGRSHAEGANLLARALAPHGGTVLWRAFVYDANVPEDRAKQAYTEFVPLDGEFSSNAWLQVKNGPIDFQPREPQHPLFGALHETRLVLELQITQEYLGFATHLAYLAPLFAEVLTADTSGCTLSDRVSGMAGVANVGTDRNWCGHPFAAANWHAFGRLSWDPSLDPETIAREWIRMTFGNDPRCTEPILDMMLASREAVVHYMTPLGLHHLMGRDHHYGPGPWVAEGRPDWTSVYYHRADAEGLGFDRTATGSNAVAQYPSPLADRLASPDTCPESLLLWFHHVGWQRPMQSGRTLWDELCLTYQAGVDAVRSMLRTWASLEELIDRARFEHVRSLLAIQEREACWWRDACLLYFQTFSGLPLPAGCDSPARSLEEYQKLEFRYVPGSADRGR